MTWLKTRLRVLQMKMRHPVAGLLAAVLIALPAMIFRAYQEWFSDHLLHHFNAVLIAVTAVMEFLLAVFVFLDRRIARLERARQKEPALSQDD